MMNNCIPHEVPSKRVLNRLITCVIAIYAAFILAVNYRPNHRFRERVSDYRFLIEAKIRRAGMILSRQKLRKVQRRTKADTEEKENELEMVWQVSYPFTGSRVGIRILQDYTGYSMGTNYGDIIDTNRGFINKFYGSVPVYPNRPNGPYKYRYDRPLPTSGNILVRTHCSGFCIDYGSDTCLFKDYAIPLLDLNYFFRSCASGTKFIQPGGKLNSVQYDQWRAKKVMVLMRDPADITLANFINYMEFNPKKYPVNDKGLKAWCDDYDNRQGSRTLRNYYNPETLKFVETNGVDVLCEAELWRITRFYNQVFKVNEFLKDEVHPVYFEDYGTNAEATITGMMDFLNYKQMEKQSNIPFFKSGDGYPYYSEAQRADMMKFVQAEASTATKEMFQRYF